MYTEVYKIVSKYDPMEIAFFADDEYDPEVRDICQQLSMANNYEELSSIIYDVFSSWFYQDAVSLEICTQMAIDIWNIYDKN